MAMAVFSEVTSRTITVTHEAVTGLGRATQKGWRKRRTPASESSISSTSMFCPGSRPKIRVSRFGFALAR